MPALIDLPRAVVDSELLVGSGLVAWAIAIAAMVAVNGMAIAHESHQHPDVSAAMPQFPFTAGLTAVADLRVPPSRTLDIMASINQVRERQCVEVTNSLHERWLDDAAKRAAHRAFRRVHLRCPACGANELVITARATHHGCRKRRDRGLSVDRRARDRRGAPLQRQQL
ncbi:MULTISPECIES: hypothetical protein [Acidiphilium]|uniref:hypothetical protein n=1 Tax=Acidiphilium TaxID=522 RepID=UPI00257A8BEB|nr:MULTISPECIES: hypothetical protein [Acidiphilium]HQT86223.1 hypothetical protein [Acidiphilium rubrum]